MEINTKNLKFELDGFNQLLEKCEDIYLNFYNELNLASNLWKDEKSEIFFKGIDSSKMKLKITIDELKQLENIYTYIYEKYSILGEKINFDIEKKDKLFTKFDNYLNEINEIIKIYKNLDLSFCPEEKIIILKQQEALEKLKIDINTLKFKIKQTILELEEIEKEVTLKISDISIEILKEQDINYFIT